MKPLHGPSTDDIMPGQRKTDRASYRLTPPSYTDGATAYDGLPNRELVRHSVGEYVRDMVHTNGVESFWSTLKRAHKGVYHRLSPKHLQQYVAEFAGLQNVREMDTLAQMQHVVAATVGKRLVYRDLAADNRQNAAAT